jgi:gliding motility-associated-like protein
MGQISNGAFFVNQNGFTVLQHNSDDLEALHELSHNHKIQGKAFLPGQTFTLRSHAYRVDFMSANPKAQVIPDKPLNTYNNYFIGNDRSKWASNCKIYQGITVKDVYPNVDVRYFSDQGTLKYDLIVNPGGKVEDIALKFDGVDKLEVKNKELRIGTSVGELKELEPYTYQYNEKGRAQIQAKYSVKNNVVRFNIKDYDHSTPLVIDPSLIFCSFTGSQADNWGFSATYGPDGSMYGGGIVFGNGFPVISGAFQTTFQGGSGGFGAGFDIGVIKLTPDGSNRVFATYVGGSGNEFPQSLIVDNQGELVIGGRSDSPNFPTTGANIGRGGGFDIIVTKLNATGTALVGSRKIGGASDDGANISPYGNNFTSLQRNYGDEARSEVNLDAAGNVYLASCTQSADFPVIGGFQSTMGGGSQDGVVLKFNSDLSNLLFSSYLGGNGNDAAYVISVNPLNNNIYVGGGTESTNLPGSSAGTIGPNNNLNGGSATVDGFVSIIANNGSAILKTTYLGTGGADQVYGLQFDRNGFPYVMGQTTGTWPVINAPWSQTNGRQFIAKLQPDLSAYVYSTVFGSGDPSPNISPVAFLVDRCENVYVSGWGAKINPYPSAGVAGLSVTPDAIKSTADVNPQTGVGEDFYFFVLKKDAAGQLYGSFFGQNGGDFPDHVDGGTSRFDKNGVIYQAICANCGGHGTFPTTPGAWATTNPARGGGQCNLALVKIAFNLSGVRSGVKAIINGRPGDTTGCIPLSVDFIDTIQNAVSYQWDFGDGSPQVSTTQPTASHTFANVGTYKVMLIAIDPNTCNIRDTSYVHIIAGNLRSLVDFNFTKLNPCDSFKYRFDNVSVAPPSRPFSGQDFEWDFGDGSPHAKAGTESVFHNYTAPGTYNVSLILLDSAYCNFPDTVIKQVRVASLVKAKFETPPYGCAPYTAQFNNTSEAGSNFTWDFGDGGTSTDLSPTHVYNSPGTYTITLTAVDSATCNIKDQTTSTITVYGIPTADFSAVPQPPVTNTPISFTNLSSTDAVNFKWVFGDGDSLITSSRDVVKHEYNATNTYSACLTASNQAGCSNTICKQVTTQVVPAVDVPTAFTPLSGGVNSVVFVRGYGIARMKFTIWARWGEKVFETDNKNTGWDGRFKGQLLPMDVYAYTLDVDFTDGTKTRKTGDITLIR